ncbi:MAG: HAD family hydrolase [Myxococcota bacterium]
MRLVIFDIDGTLTQSNEIDARCFLTVLGRYVDIDDTTVDWNDFEHVTDQGVAGELLSKVTAPDELDARLDEVRSAFIAELRKAADCTDLQPVAGAPELLHTLGESQDHLVAIATGAWEASALLKLSRAGVPIEETPIATSSDSPCRETILRTAGTRARMRYGSAVESTVYVGDGLWDLRAARSVGYGFVGLARGDRAEILREAGAEFVLPDFRDTQSCLDAFCLASPNISPRSTVPGNDA